MLGIGWSRFGNACWSRFAMIFPRCLLLAIVIGGFPVAVSSSEAVSAPSYKAMPWHLVDIWWDVGQEVAFESYSIDVTIKDRIPAGINLYVAPIGLGHLNGIPFYGGVQTQADGYTKQDRKLRKIGPGFLMSMWGERSHDAIRPSRGGFCQSSGHEGDFISVRRAYDWQPGKYTYRIVRMDREVVDGKACTWVGAFVYSHARDENIFVGSLRFPDEKLVLSRQLASFVEIYGRRIPVEKIPRVQVVFENLRVNGKAISGPGVTAVYPKGVPDYAEASWQDQRLLVEVGKQVAKRTTRREVLFKRQ